MADPRKAITHMNNDHSRSLTLYLRAYCSVSPRAAESATLEDLRLEDMVISAQGTRYTIPFDPPLNSYSDLRPRVVAMHKEALSRLSLSDTKITTYAPPKGGQCVGFTLCLAVLTFYAHRGNFAPGSLVYEGLGLSRFPGFAEFSYKWQPWIWGPLAVAHGLEAVFLLGWLRLSKHGVKAFSGLWWTWMVLGFVEGFPAWMRFDRLVKEAEEKGHEKSS